MRKASLAIVICIGGLLLPALLSAQNAAGEGDGYFARAQTAYSSGDFDAAIGYLDKAGAAYLQAEPAGGEKTATVALWLGAACYQTKKYGESIRHFERALEFFRSRGDIESQLAAINGIAGACLALEDIQGIISYYQQAVALLDKAGNKEYEALYLTYIGGYYYELKKSEEAVRSYSAAAELYAALKNNRETFNALNNIGGVYFYAGEKEKALEYYTRAYEAGRKGLSAAEAIPVLNNIAAIAADVGKYGDAAAYDLLLYPLVRSSGSPHDVYLVCLHAGAAFARDGRNDSALKYYLLALGACRDKLSQEELADILSRIGGTASELKDVRTAAAHYQELAKLYEKGKAWESLAGVYNSLGIAYDQNADHRTALEYFKRAEGLSSRIGDQKLLSAVYYNVGRAYDAMEDYAQSLPYLARYIEREADGDEKEDLIIAFLLAGSSCAHRSLFEDARAYYGRAEKAAAGYGKRELLASVYQFYGDLHERTAEYSKALGYYNDALAICEDLGQKDSRAVIMADIGSVHKDLGEYDAALEFYSQSLALNKALGIEREIATVNNNIGQLYYETGAFDKALAFMNLGLAYYEKSADRRNYASSLNNIGDVYRLWGNLEQALRYYDKAAAAAKDPELADVRAAVYNNLGMLYKAKEQYPKALEFFNKALEINKGSADKALVAVNLSNMGETYRQLRDYDKAYDFFLQALEIDKEIGVPSRILKRANGIALLYSDNGEHEKSNEYLLEILKYADAASKVDLAAYYGNLGYNYCQLQQYGPAIEYLNKAVEIKEELRRTAQGSSRMDYLASQIYTYQILIFTYASAGQPEKALETAELSRAKYLAEKLSTTEGLDAAYPGLAEIRRYLDDDTVIIGFSNVDRYFIPLRMIVTKEAVEVMELDPETLRIGVTAMGEIMAANGKSRGLHVTGGDEFKERKDAGIDASGYFYDTLSNVVYRFRSLLQDTRMDFKGNTRANEIAKALYDFLLADRGALLAEKKRIIIIPDNILGLLPFEALIDGDNRYVVETHDVQYEHSLTVMHLVNQRTYGEGRLPLIAFGGAQYEGKTQASQAPRPQSNASVSEADLKATAADAARGDGAPEIYAYLRDAVWRNLPGTLAEVSALGKMYGSAAIITGEKVSEENVKAYSDRGELARYRIIHFATHGITVPDYPELSSLVLSYPGVKRTGGDGYLQAPEIAGLKINADFVNLSACETGLGKIYGGEGIVGLPQSFIIAGANGISVSLWSVADAPTMKFMKDFYALIRGGGVKYAAAESAEKRAFIKSRDYRHPYFWAPFVYYGK